MSANRVYCRAQRSAVLSAAISSCLAMSAGAAQAPSNASTSDAPLEEVVVTGFRASLADALENKRESNQIIESVSAEDIGKFPDQNVAEALQRLSGVQIDRANGQGTRVRIRGLDQNVTLLNEDIFLTGLEVFTLGEGNDANVDSLEGIPSELLGGIDVYKSPNPSQSEGGLGGIVNLKTRSPFDLPGTTFAGNLRYADSGEGWEPLGALVFSNQFNDRLAVIASVSYDKQQFQTDVLGGHNRGNWRLSARPDRTTVPNYFAPEYRYTTDRDEERERMGASLSVAFRPSESTELQAQWFHSDLEVVTQEASLKFPFASESPGLDTSQPYTIDRNGVLLSGTIIANSAEAISYVRNSDISSDNFQLKFNFGGSGTLRGSASAAYSKAEMDSVSGNADVRYTQYSVPTADPTSPTGFSHRAANPSAPANYRYTYNNRGGTLPSFDLAGAQNLYTNPANGFFKSHWVFGDSAELENWAVGGELEFDPPFISGDNVVLTGGVRLANRTVQYDRGRYLADYSNRGELNGTNYGQNWTPFGYFQDGAIGYKSCELPASAPRPGNCTNRFGNSPPLITPFQTFVGTGGRVETINRFWDSGRVAGGSVLVQSRSQMQDPVAWIQALYPNTPFAFFREPLQSYEVEEETTSAYAMLDLGTPADNYHVNVGARVVRTDLTIDRNAASNPNPTYWGTDSWNGVLRDFTTLSTKRDYTDILPSANVVLDVTDAGKVRFSAARVLARQNLFELGRGFAPEFTRNPITDRFEFTNGTDGNPDLEPYRASQFDVGYEYYFGRQGLLSATLFWKEVESFNSIVTAPRVVADQSPAGSRPGPVTQTVNGRGGFIRGFELGAQMAFDWGGGFNVNYTYSDSESPTFNDIDRDLPIPGVAENAFNAQIYYQNFGFEARLSYTWRDKSFFGNFGFADEVAPFDPNSSADNLTRTYGRWNRDYGQLDAQIGYQITDRIGVTLEAINITEEDQSQYLQYENLPFTFESGTRRLLLGIRGSF
jgi:iron complex outermembrane recepter protein